MSYSLIINSVDLSIRIIGNGNSGKTDYYNRLYNYVKSEYENVKIHTFKGSFVKNEIHRFIIEIVMHKTLYKVEIISDNSANSIGGYNPKHEAYSYIFVKDTTNIPIPMELFTLEGTAFTINRNTYPIVTAYSKCDISGYDVGISDDEFDISHGIPDNKLLLPIISIIHKINNKINND